MLVTPSPNSDLYSDLSARNKLDPAQLIADFANECDLDGFVGKLIPPDMQEDILFLQKLFEKNQHNSLSIEGNVRIPKVIHQIWMGGPLPEKFQRFQDNWRRLHPDWEFKLWTDYEIKSFDFESRDIFDAVDCFGHKGDILRVEILKRYGGLYVDTDYDCFRAHDIFHHAYDFYATVRPFPALYMMMPDIIKTPLTICSSILGSVPNHPFHDEYLRMVRLNLGNPLIPKLAAQIPLWQRSNSQLRQFAYNARFNLQTSYAPFRDAFLSVARNNAERMVAMPPNYFNSLDTWWTAYRFGFPMYWKALIPFLIAGQHKAYKFGSINPAAYSVHYSSGAWISRSQSNLILKLLFQPKTLFGLK